MPLDLKDTGDSGTGKQKVQPIQHKAAPGGTGGNSKLVAVLFILIVLGATAFLLYRAGILGGKKTPVAEQALTSPSDAQPAAAPETVSVSPTLEPPLSGNVSQQPAEKSISPEREVVRETKPAGTGRFTIYIGSYRNRRIAEEEAGRWVDAGYTAFVSVSGSSCRVCLGRYETRREAKEEAEKFKDAFEAGYWIGTVQ